MSTKMMPSSELRAAVDDLSDGSWRCAHPGLGLVAYGHTAAEAAEAAEKIVSAYSLLIDDLFRRGSAKAVRSRLSKGAIEFELSEQLHEGEPLLRLTLELSEKRAPDSGKAAGLTLSLSLNASLNASLSAPQPLPLVSLRSVFAAQLQMGYVPGGDVGRAGRVYGPRAVKC